VKVAAVSHSCVVDVNQQLFFELSQRPNLDVLVIAPRVWRSSLLGKVRFRALPGLNCKVHNLTPTLAGHNALHFYRGYAKVLEAFQPDILHIDEEPWSLAAWQFTRLKAQLGTRSLIYTKQNIFRQYPFPFSALQSWVLEHTDIVAATNSEGAQVLRRKGFKGPIKVIPFAFDAPLFVPAPSIKLRRALGLSGPVVGYMGRLTPGKGVGLLINAFAEVVREPNGEPPSLLIVGSGPKEEALRRRATERGVEEAVVFVPAVRHTEAARYLNCMDVLVLPSRTTPGWKEQFGRVLVEALACEVPVIGSDSGEIPNIIRTTGGGLVFREGDVADLTLKLRQMLDDWDTAQDLARKGRREVLARYTYEAIADQYLEAYEEALSVPQRG